MARSADGGGTITNLLALPLLVPLATAIGCLAAWNHVRVQRGVSLVGTLGLLATGLVLLRRVAGGTILTLDVGGWPAPFGIVLVGDALAAIMVVLAAVVAVAAVASSPSSVPRHVEARGYYPLVQVLLLGVSGAFLTGDLFNMYVWFEVLLISSFVLLVLGGSRLEMEGGIKYVVLNLLASVLFLAAIGLLYGAAGTLNLAHLATVLPDLGTPRLLTVVAVLLLVAFGIKAALFPLFFWLPDAYPAPAVPITALFSGLLTKVGVYALIRVFTLVLPPALLLPGTLLAWSAGFTMVVGVLGAVAQHEVRTLLAFHMVSQIGYLVMGLALATPLALAGTVFFLAHNILAKSNLFLVSGLLDRAGGSFDLHELGGLLHRAPVVAVLFAVPALSLAGLPPFSGFWGKLALAAAGVRVEAYLLVAAALATSLLTLLSMTKIWNQAFWRPHPREGRAGAGSPEGLPVNLVVPVAVLGLLSLLLGLAPAPFLALAERAAGQLHDPTAYIEAVLGPEVGI